MQLEDGFASVIWLQQTGFGEDLYLCPLAHVDTCREPKVLATSQEGRTINFSRLAQSGDRSCIAWTGPVDDSGASPENDARSRLIMAKLGDGS